MEMFTAENLKQVYLDWLNKINFIDLVDGYIEIKTPFVDFNNSIISIFAYKVDDKIILTDYGHLINEFNIININLFSKNRKRLLDRVLSNFHMKFDTETSHFYTEVNNLKDLPLRKHLFVQGLLTINDFFLTSNKNVTNMFLYDVIQYFDRFDVPYNSNSYQIIGKSGLPSSFDLSIGKVASKGLPARNVKVYNTLRTDTTKILLFTMDDLRDILDDAKFTIIINDSNTISEDNLQKLYNSGIEVFGYSMIKELTSPYSN